MSCNFLANCTACLAVGKCSWCDSEATSYCLDASLSYCYNGHLRSDDKCVISEAQNLEIAMLVSPAFFLLSLLMCVYVMRNYRDQVMDCFQVFLSCVCGIHTAQVLVVQSDVEDEPGPVTIYYRNKELPFAEAQIRDVECVSQSPGEIRAVEGCFPVVQLLGPSEVTPTPTPTRMNVEDATMELTAVQIEGSDGLVAETSVTVNATPPTTPSISPPLAPGAIAAKCRVSEV